MKLPPTCGCICFCECFEMVWWLFFVPFPSCSELWVANLCGFHQWTPTHNVLQPDLTNEKHSGAQKASAPLSVLTHLLSSSPRVPLCPHSPSSLLYHVLLSWKSGQPISNPSTRVAEMRESWLARPGQHQWAPGSARDTASIWKVETIKEDTQCDPQAPTGVAYTHEHLETHVASCTLVHLHTCNTHLHTCEYAPCTCHTHAKNIVCGIGWLLTRKCRWVPKLIAYFLLICILTFTWLTFWKVPYLCLGWYTIKENISSFKMKQLTAAWFSEHMSLEKSLP